MRQALTIATVALALHASAAHADGTDSSSRVPEKLTSVPSPLGSAERSTPAESPAQAVGENITAKQAAVLLGPLFGKGGAGIGPLFGGGPGVVDVPGVVDRLIRLGLLQVAARVGPEPRTGKTDRRPRLFELKQVKQLLSDLQGETVSLDEARKIRLAKRESDEALAFIRKYFRQRAELGAEVPTGEPSQAFETLISSGAVDERELAMSKLAYYRSAIAKLEAQTKELNRQIDARYTEQRARRESRLAGGAGRAWKRLGAALKRSDGAVEPIDAALRQLSAAARQQLLRLVRPYATRRRETAAHREAAAAQDGLMRATAQIESQREQTRRYRAELKDLVSGWPRVERKSLEQALGGNAFAIELARVLDLPAGPKVLATDPDGRVLLSADPPLVLRPVGKELVAVTSVADIAPDFPTQTEIHDRRHGPARLDASEIIGSTRVRLSREFRRTGEGRMDPTSEREPVAQLFRSRTVGTVNLITGAASIALRPEILGPLRSLGPQDEQAFFADPLLGDRKKILDGMYGGSPAARAQAERLWKELREDARGGEVDLSVPGPVTLYEWHTLPGLGSGRRRVPSQPQLEQLGIHAARLWGKKTRFIAFAELRAQWGAPSLGHAEVVEDERRKQREERRRAAKQAAKPKQAAVLPPSKGPILALAKLLAHCAGKGPTCQAVDWLQKRIPAGRKRAASSLVARARVAAGGRLSRIWGGAGGGVTRTRHQGSAP